jgi:hypothetical protein
MMRYIRKGRIDELALLHYVRLVGGWHMALLSGRVLCWHLGYHVTRCFFMFSKCFSTGVVLALFKSLRMDGTCARRAWETGILY